MNIKLTLAQAEEILNETISRRFSNKFSVVTEIMPDTTNVPRLYDNKEMREHNKIYLIKLYHKLSPIYRIISCESKKMPKKFGIFLF